MYGTRVNGINYKGSRCILSEGDCLGFGCKTEGKYNKDKRDTKHLVYRLTVGIGIGSCETIEVLTSDESGDEIQHYSSFSGDYETEDECPSADELDEKPDIHSLMRMHNVSKQIKEEIDWNLHEPEREQPSEVNEPVIIDYVDLSDSEDELETYEPSSKRIRRDDNDYDNYFAQTSEPEVRTVNPYMVSEYQMKETILKEKVKNVVRSRGQQLSTALLSGDATAFSSQYIKSPIKYDPFMTPTSSNSENIPYNNGEMHDEFATEKIINDFISEVTSWPFKWLSERKSNPLTFKMQAHPLDVNYTDLDTFQRWELNYFLKVVCTN